MITCQADPRPTSETALRVVIALQVLALAGSVGAFRGLVAAGAAEAVAVPLTLLNLLVFPIVAVRAMKRARLSARPRCYVAIAEVGLWWASAFALSPLVQ